MLPYATLHALSGRTYRSGASIRPCLVLVCFADVPAEHRALKSSKDLRARKIVLDGDLTSMQRRTRQGRLIRFHALKRDGKRPFWRYDRLLYTENGRVVEHEVPSTISPPSYAIMAPRGLLVVLVHLPLLPLPILGVMGVRTPMLLVLLQLLAPHSALCLLPLHCAHQLVLHLC